MNNDQSIFDFKSLQSIFSDRLTSPFFGAVIISWPFINYKFLVVLFSANGVQWTFDYIDGTLYSTDLERIIYWYIYPLSAGIYYNFFHEPVKAILQYGHGYAIRLAKLISASAEGIKLYTKADLSNELSNCQSEVERLNSTIHKTNQKYLNDTRTLRNENTNIKSNLNQLVLSIYAADSGLRADNLHPDFITSNNTTQEEKIKTIKSLMASNTFNKTIEFVNEILSYHTRTNRHEALSLEDYSRYHLVRFDMPAVTLASIAAIWGLIEMDEIFNPSSTITFPENGIKARTLIKLVDQVRSQS